ncbi:MAG: PQQ-dependent sugar dehydrogenase [Thermoanaerobaculia bacterium]
MRRRSLAAALVLTVAASAAAAATLPAGFTETFISGLSSPTAMAIAPDGRILVCEQGGALRVIKNGALLPTPFVTLTVDSFFERGLLGVAFDPNFVTNKYVYVYYTVPGSPPHNRTSRFTANGDVAVPGSELILLELDNLSAGNHNGGALHFGLDGKLYIGVGENAVPANAQNLSNLLGKLLRINSDGTIPPDNPFVGVAGGRGEIWALGLRNPFTFGVQPFTGRIFIDDVGQNTWEEINDGSSGANYGWPDCEGDCSPPDPDFTDPYYFYSHAGGACSIAGGGFYNPEVPQFPADYTGDYFFADYCGDWIKRIDTTNLAVTDFATGISSPVDLHVDFVGNLYYLARGSGRVYKVVYTASAAPVITENPESQTVAVGSTATFTVGASGQAPLAYQWQKDSANIAGATSPSYTTPTLVLGDNGNQYRCIVSNSSGSATSAQAVLTVLNDQAPIATISNPPSGTTYAAGNTINYSGSGTDPEDGTLPSSALTWWVNFHHDTHVHPFIPPTSGSTGGSFVIPTVGETSPNVWYRIHLSVVDSVGLTNEKFRDVVPRTTTMTFATSPSGLQMKIDGQSFTAPVAVVGVENMTRTIEAPSPQTLDGTTYTWVSWSDGGARTHNISTPATDTTFTAVFTGPGLGPSVSGISPSSGPAAGGTGVTITGASFLAGATAKVGGIAATGVSFVDGSHLTASTPPLTPATLNDVTVTNPGNATGTLVEGWFADFLDVPQSNGFHADIEKVFRNGVSAGCGAGNYCPTSLVTRAQMAVFLLKGEHGGSYQPPACSGTIFADVPCPGGTNVNWINQLSAEGITGGCGGGNYCPASLLTRAQMAVFLLKGKHGGSYQPPACSGTVFEDVPCPGAPFVDWINQLSAEGITVGCGGGNYCPTAATPRQQMATFLVRTFDLP